MVPGYTAIREKLRGAYIAICGIDKCGKSTQIIRLRNFLRARGLDVSVLKEPLKNGTWGGMIYFDLNRKNGVHKKYPYEFQRLFVLDRLENIRERVFPELRRGAVVIQDRSFVATVCYGAQEATYEEMARFLDLNQEIIGRKMLWPDILIILDIPVWMAIERLKKSKKIADGYEDEDFLERVRNNYLYFPAFLKTNFFNRGIRGNPPVAPVIIDGSGDEESVFLKIRAEVENLLESKKRLNFWSYNLYFPYL